MLIALLMLLGCTERFPPTEGVACGDVFDTSQVHEVDVQMTPETFDALRDEFVNWEERRNAGLDVKPYHPLESFTYQCQTVYDAEIRLKGNPCCSWDDEKMQFTVNFKRNDDGARFQGLRKIAFDAPFYDPSLLRERLAYSAFEDMGQAASKVNHVRLNINGEYYGLYANIEVLDKEWLQDRMSDDDAEGDLWKLDYLAARFEPRTNSSTATRDRFNELMNADSLEDLQGLMDIETTLDSVAAEAIVNQSDGFWPGGINFYLYDHPRLGFQMLPWDLDNTWDRWPHNIAPTYRGGSFYATQSLEILYEDPGLMQFYSDSIARRLARVDRDTLLERIDQWDAEIRPHLEEDPHRPFTMEEHDTKVRELRNSVRDHLRFLQSWVDDNASSDVF